VAIGGLAFEALPRAIPSLTEFVDGTEKPIVTLCKVGHDLNFTFPGYWYAGRIAPSYLTWIASELCTAVPDDPGAIARETDIISRTWVQVAANYAVLLIRKGALPQLL
jgi:hypothetical protein